MKHETAPQTGLGYTTRNTATLEAVHPTGGVQRRTQPFAGCKEHQAEQSATRPGGLAADGFLKQCFLPLYLPGKDLPLQEKTERGVLCSRAVLCEHLQLGAADFSDKPYPYNIMLMYWHAQKQIAATRPDLELYIVGDQTCNVSFAAKQVAEREYSLYYIPVLPLYRLLKSGKHKQSADLLLSVFAYLYHIVHIPYYRDGSSFLLSHYEMISDWIENDRAELDEDDFNFHQSGLRSAEYYGDIIGRKIHNLYHLEHFEERLAKAKPLGKFEERCRDVANKALNLWREFPESNLYTHLGDLAPGDEEYDEDDYPNIIEVEEYVHFIAENEGSLYDSIQQNIDAELNEKMYWQEHTLTSVYDKNFKPQADSLDFESRLFVLLDELCYILNELP
jgi:hypothetical protein